MRETGARDQLVSRGQIAKVFQGFAVVAQGARTSSPARAHDLTGTMMSA